MSDKKGEFQNLENEPMDENEMASMMEQEGTEAQIIPDMEEVEDIAEENPKSEEKSQEEGESFSPLMEPKKNNTKKGVITIAAIGIAAVLTLCICIILLRDREKKAIEQGQVGAESKNDGNLTDGAEAGSASGLAQNLLEEEVSYPEVDVVLGEYKGLNVTMTPVEVSDEDVQAELDYLLSSSQTVAEVTERKDVQDGDVTVIDYVGSVDGVEFAGGSAQGQELVIGSGSFIDGFEEQIIGHKLGENFDINVTFPEDYHNPELAGKDAVFNITVQMIGYYTTPELTDEFIASNTEYSNIEEYKEGTYNSLVQTAKDNAQSQKEMDLITLALENSEFNGLSEEEVQAKSNEMKAEYEMMASNYGMDLATLVGIYFGMDEDTFNEEIAKAAELQVKQGYLLKKIIEVENLSVSEEDYKAGLEEFAAMYSTGTTEEFENLYGRELIEEVLLNDKALNIIFDSAVVSNE